MSIRIKAAILARESSYYGASTVLDEKVFDTEKMDNVIFGYLIPPTDNGVGSPSYVMSFTENPLPPSNAIRGIDFDYNHSVNIRKHYTISGDSAAYATALGGTGTTNVNALITISPLSPYTLI